MTLSDFKNIPHRAIWKLSWPIVLSNLATPLVQSIDTAVMGHAENPLLLPAVAAGSMIVLTIVWLFAFLRMSTTGMTAQALGRNDESGMQRVLAQGGAIALLLSLLLLLISPWLVSGSLVLLGPSESVLPYAKDYVQIRFIGFPAILLQFVLIGWLIGRHDSKTPLIMLVVANSLNALLDLFFVFELGLGIKGVAWASVIAEYTACAIGFVKVNTHFNLVYFIKSRSADIKIHYMMRFINLNRDLLIRVILLEAVFFFFIRESAGLGDLTLAVNQIGINLIMLIAASLDGIAYAGESLTGRAIGRNNPSEARVMIIGIGVWSLVFSCLLTLTLCFSFEIITNFYTNQNEVSEYLHLYWLYLVLFPVVSVGAYWLDGIMLGATAGNRLRDGMVIATFAVFLPAWWLFSSLGNHGLWLALVCFMLGRFIPLAWYLKKDFSGWFKSKARPSFS